MKRSIVSIIVFACLLLVLAFVANFNAVSSANAQVGNTGVIVRCLKSDYWIDIGAQSDLTCYAADGTSFVTVPASHYLFITDIFVAPFSGAATGNWGLNILVPGSAGYPITWFNWSTGGTYNQHFTTPFIIVKAGEKLVAQNFGNSATDIAPVLYGVLTTNANYLPLITK